MRIPGPTGTPPSWGLARALRGGAILFTGLLSLGCPGAPPPRAVLPPRSPATRAPPQVRVRVAAPQAYYLYLRAELRRARGEVAEARRLLRQALLVSVTLSALL